MNGTTRDLLRLVQAYESSTHLRQTIIALALAFANLFFCAYFERYLAGPDWHQALITLIAIETAILVAVAMGIHLQIVDPILKRTRIHPVPTSARFMFVVLSLVRHRYILLLWGSAVFSMTLMMHPASGSVPLVILAFLVPGAAFLITAAALMVLLERWTASGSIALAALGIVTCLTGMLSIVYPESNIIGMLVPLRWCAMACTAALAGEPGISLLRLLPFAAMAGIAWIGGTRYA